MRKLISHTILTLDGVATFDAVADTIIELRGGEAGEDFFRRVADEDAMLLGRTTYEEWADYWPNSTNEPFASHINAFPNSSSRARRTPCRGVNTGTDARRRRSCRRDRRLNSNPEGTSASMAASRSSRACCRRTCSTRCASRSNPFSRARANDSSMTSVPETTSPRQLDDREQRGRGLDLRTRDMNP